MIYYLSFSLVFFGAKNPMGDNLSLGKLSFGRRELSDIANIKVSEEDIPLKKGESHTFKLSSGTIEGWKKNKERLNIPDPKVVALFFSFLSFGDGTGYIGSTGVYVPPAPKP